MTTLIPKFDLMDGGFTPLGAINRPINEKLSEIVSIKDFGAVGDGITNDTVAIQAALDSGKSLVYFPSGNYVCGAITISTDGQILQGAGALETQITSNAKPLIIFNVEADHVSIKDMKFQCGVLSTTPSTVDTVAIKSFNSYLSISNVITNQFALGIQISDGVRNTIEKCRVICETHSYIGISLSGGGEHTVNNNIVQASSDLFSGLALIYVFNSPANVITNNYITRGIGVGIYAFANPALFGNNYIVIKDNDIDFIYNWSIYINGYYQVHISDNWLSSGNRWNGTLPASGANIYNNATGQISLENCLEFFVTNNSIYQSEGEYAGTQALTPSQPSYGSYFYNCSFGVVMGNVSQDNSVGFSTVTNCTYNQFIANTTGQIIGLGPDGTPQYTGFQDDGTGVSNVYTSNIIHNLNSNPPQNYVGINTYTLPNINSVTSWGNIAYATFTSSKAVITSAISASGTIAGQTAPFSVAIGKYYQVTVFVTLNSGQLPNLGIYDGTGGSFDYGPTALVAGFNTITYKASATGSSASLIVQNTTATNFSLTSKAIEFTF